MGYAEEAFRKPAATQELDGLLLAARRARIKS